MGRNGAGKSTLLAAWPGRLRRTAGSVRLGTPRPGAAPHPRELVRQVGLVPQDPALLLYAETVAAECARRRPRLRAAAPGSTARAPRPAHAGARRATSTPATSPRASASPSPWPSSSPAAPGAASCSTSRPAGWTTPPSAGWSACCAAWPPAGTPWLLATHDVELAAEVADRVVVLADGEVVADGAARRVLAASPAFAPQVAKVLHPLPFLTVAEVVAAVGAAS